MGDINLNYLRWDISPQNMNSYDRVKKPMIDKFKTNFLSKGFTILSSTPTKIHDDPDAASSCLDLMITNKLDKISSRNQFI